MATNYEIAVDFGATLASGNDFLKNFQSQSTLEQMTAATSFLAAANSTISMLQNGGRGQEVGVRSCNHEFGDVGVSPWRDLSKLRNNKKTAVFQCARRQPATAA